MNNPLQLNSIDDVIFQLEQIVNWSKLNSSRAGYFAALYLKVTINIKAGIDQRIFEDPERMEKLDILFAGRYIEAFYQYRNGGNPTDSWQCAFSASEKYWPIVLQHLLLGINAHINLDLGIAAAETSPGEKLPDLKHDFDHVNEILSSLVDGVVKDLSEVWPMLRWVSKILGSVQDSLINFSVKIARDEAWKFASDLSQSDKRDWELKIREKDRSISLFAAAIRFPGIHGFILSKLIRLGERGSVTDTIDLLKS